MQWIYNFLQCTVVICHWEKGSKSKPWINQLERSAPPLQVKWSDLAPPRKSSKRKSRRKRRTVWRKKKKVQKKKKRSLEIVSPSSCARVAARAVYVLTWYIQTADNWPAHYTTECITPHVFLPSSNTQQLLQKIPTKCSQKCKLSGLSVSSGYRQTRGGGSSPSK